MKQPTRTPWQRLTLSLFGIILVALMWRWSVAHLYTLPTDALASFTSLTTNAYYTISAIVIFMVTGRLMYEWKMNTQQMTNVVSEAKHITEDINKNINIKYAKTHDFDDGGQDLDVTSLDL